MCASVLVLPDPAPARMTALGTSRSSGRFCSHPSAEATQDGSESSGIWHPALGRLQRLEMINLPGELYCYPGYHLTSTGDTIRRNACQVLEPALHALAPNVTYNRVYGK